jgi:hypothetical protein
MYLHATPGKPGQPLTESVAESHFYMVAAISIDAAFALLVVVFLARWNYLLPAFF